MPILDSQMPIAARYGKVIALFALSILCIFGISAGWEFWAERFFDGIVGIPYIDGGGHWEFILEEAGFAAVGMLPSFYIVLRATRAVREALETERLARERAEEAGKAKMIFLANMSHELRTPLNAIIGFSEINLDNSDMDPKKAHEHTQIVHDSGRHLLSLINDVLDIARSDGGSLKLDYRAVDVSRLVCEAAADFAQRAQDNEIALVVKPASTPILVRADEERMRRAIRNLVSNATKFTPPGGRVTVTASQQGKEAVIEILDTGIGITSTDMERIWRPFEQVDNSFTRKYEGTGLGLPLARRFIETMGGTLALASKPGSGTSVRVSFPLTAAAAPVKPEKVSSVSASLVCVA